MLFARAWALVSLAGLLAACTSANCDPNQADFFSGIGNAASGCYAAKNRAYQGQLDQSGELRKQQLMHAEDAANDARKANLDLAAAQSRLDSADRQRAIMEGQLDAMRHRTDISQATLQRAQRAIDELRQRQAAARASPTPQALDEVEQQQRAAQQRLRDLTAGH
jgi:hypothetical protein